MSNAATPKRGLSGTEQAQPVMFAEILEALPDPVLAVTNFGHIQYANKAAQSMFELSPSPSGEVFLDSVYLPCNPHSGEVHDSVVKLFADKPHRGPTQRVIRIADRNGKQITALETGVRVMENNGSGSYIVLSLYMQDPVNQLAIIPQKMDSFARLASGLAHDFNNLLTVVTSNLFMARCSLDAKNEIGKMLEEAEKAAFKASNLTSQLLVLCDQGEIIKVETDIKAILQNMIGFVIPSEAYEYTLDFDDNLYHIAGDPGKIDQLFAGLIKNAVEAMPSGGSIRIKGENIVLDSGCSPPMTPGDYVHIIISDHGTGIPHHDIHKVFDPYFTTKKDAKGLGLTIAYSVVEQHGGNISLQSTSEGASVRIILPAFKKAKTGSVSMEKPAISGRILLMDDEESIRRPIQKILSTLGYEVEMASEGQEALQKFQAAYDENNPFEVIILDLTVKDGMGGEKTAKEMLRRKTGARIILMSGYVNDPLMVHYQEHGFVGAITKPFSIDDINAYLQSILETPK